MAYPRRERICFVAPSFSGLPGGGARVYYEHANQLVSRGYRISVVHPLNLRGTFPGRMVDLARGKIRDLRAGNIHQRVSWMHVHPAVEFVFVDQLTESMPLPPAELYVGTYWRTSEILGRRAPDHSRSIQLVQAYETWAGPADRVDATWRLPFHIAVVSESLRRKGLELGVPAQQLHVVPNGLDHRLFRPTVPLPDRPACLGFLAHENPAKGLHDTIEVVKLVHRRRPDVPVIAFGAARRPQLLPSYVTYLRRPTGQHLVEEVYNKLSVFLCASLSEGWGFPSIEAMACGAALVSTRNGGVDDFARHEESALLCDIGDSAGLADSVLTLLADEPRRAGLAASGVTRAAEFTWDSSGAAFHAVVRAALNVTAQGP